MKRSFDFTVCVLGALLLNLVLGCSIYFNAAHATKTNDEAQASMEVFNAALEKIHSEYVDGKDLTYHQLVYSALKGAVQRLDPHSEFLERRFLPGVAGRHRRPVWRRGPRWWAPRTARSRSSRPWMMHARLARRRLERRPHHQGGGRER